MSAKTGSKGRKEAPMSQRTVILLLISGFATIVAAFQY